MMTIHDPDQPLKPIEPGDLVAYFPEGGKMLLAEVQDVWTGAAYVVGTLPALTFQVGDTVTQPVRHFEHPNQYPHWRYLDAKAKAGVGGNPAPAVESKNGKRLRR